MNNKELFSSFPTIDEEFDMVCVDVVKIADGDDTSYYPLLRYAIRDLENKSVDAGVTIRVGYVAKDLPEASEFVANLVRLGIFLVPVSSLGTVYDQEMKELHDVDWNDYISLVGEKQGAAPNKYLH